VKAVFRWGRRFHIDQQQNYSPHTTQVRVAQRRFLPTEEINAQVSTFPFRRANLLLAPELRNFHADVEFLRAAAEGAATFVDKLSRCQQFAV
jgi:phospholipase/lecithinase/hemolysin